MNRKVLLLEPNYKNKYPPMGLMKLSTYYKAIGDKVTFFKGNLEDLILEEIYTLLLNKLKANDSLFHWEKYKPEIISFLKKGQSKDLQNIQPICTNSIIESLFIYYRKFYSKKLYQEPENKFFDIVCVTTLFTFYWDITIKTIQFAKLICKDPNKVLVGGVMASILSKEIYDATGIKPFIGTLHTPGELDKDNNLIIDTLPLDYSILEEIDYQYPASNAYYAYMTRGCINKCKFCAVPKLEPNYIDYIPVSKQIDYTKNNFGAKKDLLLLDNNVLASKNLHMIIDDIKQAGYTKNAKFSEPNQYEIVIENLKKGYNDKAYIKACIKQYKKLFQKLSTDELSNVYELIYRYDLMHEYTATKENILATYNDFKPLFEKIYTGSSRLCFVDFNQGIDSRLITDDNMQKLAEIPVRPLRIAFDHWSLRSTYEKAVRTAVKHGHLHLSNYILYNFEDKPIELYYRLKLNVELCEELGASIYSFPMKYHPIDDPEYFSNRHYIGTHWNRKFIRTIQAILNSTKGKVGKGYSFFCKAFGENEKEFEKLLYMPEAMIVYRLFFEEKGITEAWWNEFSNLSYSEKEIIKPIIENNEFNFVHSTISNNKILSVLNYYKISREDAQKELLKK